MADSDNGLLTGIASGLPVVGSVWNAISTGRQNRKNREHQEYMYNKERADALADWNMNNSYNSPEAQMARLVKAGLNPNMVYGSGSAVNTSSTPSPTHAAPYRGEAPQLDIPNLVGGYYNIATQVQGLNNMKKQADLTDANIALTEARKNGIVLDNAFKTDTMFPRTNNEMAKYSINSSRSSYELSRALVQKELQDALIDRGKLTNEAIRLDNINRGKAGKFTDLRSTAQALANKETSATQNFDLTRTNLAGLAQLLIRLIK